MINSAFKYFGYLVIILGFIVMGVVSYFQYMPITVLEIKQPIEIVNKNSINAGGTLYYKIFYKKHYNLVADVTYQLIDGYVVLIDNIPSNIPKGEGEYIIPVSVPSQVKEGYYILRISVLYKVSSLRTVTEVFETERFHIGPSKDALTIQKLNVELKNLLIEQEKIKRTQTVHSFTTQNNNEKLQNVENILKNQSTILEKLDKIDTKVSE